MRSLLVSAALLTSGATAVAAEFPPNRLVVAGGTSNDLRQFKGGLEVGLPITLLGSTPRGMGSLALFVKGKAKGGVFLPKTAKGSLEFGHPHFAFSGKLVTVKSLN